MLEVDGDEDARVVVLGARTRIGAGSTGRTIKTPVKFFVLPQSPAIAPWGGLLRRWNRLGRPASVPIAGRGDVRITWIGRDSVLIGDRRIILERIDARGTGWGRRTVWTDTTGGLVASLGGMTGTFALREGYEAATPYLLESARRDALRLVRNASEDVKPARSGTFAIVGASVLDGERETPLRNAVVLVEDGRIAQIGTRAKVKIGKGIPTVQGTGLTVIPGVRAEGWSVSDFGWGPGALARGIVGVRLAPQSDAGLGEVRSELERDGTVAPRLLGATDTPTPSCFARGNRRTSWWWRAHCGASRNHRRACDGFRSAGGCTRRASCGRPGASALGWLIPQRAVTAETQRARDRRELPQRTATAELW